MSKRRIIGISAYYHDAAVCLVEDGQIIYAAQEERFSRIKNDASFPELALRNCLQYTQTRLSETDAVVYYEKPFLKFERILNTFLQNAPRGLRTFIQAMHVWTQEKLFLKDTIYRKLKTIDDDYDRQRTPLLFSEHHLSHAASAFYPSPYQEAAILTIDGVGEYTTTSLAFGSDNKIDILKELHFPHSIGLLYSSVTYFLGFKVNSDEYKVMGLAAYGNPEADETKQFSDIIEKELIQLNTDGSYKLHLKHFSFAYGLTMVNDKDWHKLFGLKKRQPSDELTQRHCNLAYAFQKVTEKAVLNLCQEIKRLTNASNLCLAGGVALNSVINGIIRDKNLFSGIFIQPASGDAGAALGAALALDYLYFKGERIIQYPDAMKNSLLGNSYTSDDLKAIIDKHPDWHHCSTEEELCRKTAESIADGKVIGWFQGRMEFGPRALGNRSILADAGNPEMQKRLNLKIKNRESFRPFAPAVLEEDVHLYFEMEGNSPYMLQVHPLKKSHLRPVPDGYPASSIQDKLYTVKSTIPAVTHVDFSARIQTVNENQHPLFWKLIHTYKQISGVSMIVNTSFNVKDEPIVCTPEDAYNCFMKTGMDVLVVENYIFYK